MSQSQPTESWDEHYEIILRQSRDSAASSERWRRCYNQALQKMSACHAIGLQACRRHDEWYAHGYSGDAISVLANMRQTITLMLSELMPDSIKAGTPVTPPGQCPQAEQRDPHARTAQPAGLEPGGASLQRASRQENSTTDGERLDAIERNSWFLGKTPSGLWRIIRDQVVGMPQAADVRTAIDHAIKGQHQQESEAAKPGDCAQADNGNQPVSPERKLSATDAGTNPADAA